MKSKAVFLFLSVFIVASLLVGIAHICLAQEENESREPKVLAFYYPWYGTPKISGRWRHWDEGGHNPDKFNENGLRDIGATDHPLNDVYDSHNPKIIQEHLKLAEDAGIDAFILSWWGQNDFHDQALRLFLDEIEKSKSKVRMTIYYESVPDYDSDKAVADFLYILENYGKRESFFMVGGKPVLFIYSRAFYQLLNLWTGVLSKVKEEYDSIFIVDCKSSHSIRIFDGGHIYNPVMEIVAGRDMGQSYKNLVETCRELGKISAVTIIPGYDDSHIGRGRSTVANREEGELYRRLWNCAIASNPDWILITSFNEWHEGSEIEPSVEYKDMYINLTREFSSKFKDREPLH